MQINLSAWASLVQDVAAGLQVLPPGLSNCLDPEVLNLFHHLEAVTQVKFCHLCYYPETNCRCAGVPPMTPPTSWSQIMEQTPGYGMTTPSGGVATLSTSLGGMSRLVPPLPEIFHLEPISVEGPYVPEAGHNPAMQTSCWEGQMAKGHSEHEGSGAVGSSDGPSHLYSPRVNRQTRISSWCSCRVKLQDWESPLTLRPPSLLPLTVRTPMYVEDRLPKTEMRAIGLPAIPREDGRCPPSGRPISQCLTRRVDAQLGCLVMSLHPPPQALRRPPLETL